MAAPVTPLPSKRDWLKSVHPVYAEQAETWAVNERRLRGGVEVIDELRRFDWEKENGEHYTLRQAMAAYMPFPSEFASSLVGQMMRKSPKVDDGGLSFGTLGTVRRERDKNDPTEAEMVYYNVDGVGNDGSQWDNFWARAAERACATGHRWMFVEAPAERALTKADVLSGRRPYLVEYSPLSVTNWSIQNGRLDWAIIVSLSREPKVDENGSLEGNNPEFNYLLLVRKGITALGTGYAGGGWWLYNADLEQVPNQTGNWSKTAGEIPMFPLFYQRDNGTPGKITTYNNIEDSHPAISRSGTHELGNVAISYMNLSSAADFDAWDAAMSIIYVLGVDDKGHNVIVNRLKEGSRVIPVPINADTEKIPSVYDGSTGLVAAEVFKSRLDAKMEEARRLAALEVTSTPESSGISKQAGFADLKSPRLALMASEVEQAQNSAIHFLELRFGHAKPEGAVIWTRDFELIPVSQAVTTMFTLHKLSGVQSPTLVAKALVAAGRERGLINDDEEGKKIKDEYTESAKNPNPQPLTPDGAGDTGKDHGIGGDGRGQPPGTPRPERAGVAS